MLMANISRAYKYHVENLRAVEAGILESDRILRDAISRGLVTRITPLVRLNTMLLGVWAEDRQKKLLYEPNAFTTDERDQILKRRTQHEQWKATVEAAFKKHYAVRRVTEKSLSPTAFFRYGKVQQVLSEDLEAVIEIRNKLAHGQWVYPFASGSTEKVSKEAHLSLQSENLLTLRFKKQLLVTISELVNLLVSNRGAFERDFDSAFIHLAQAKSNLRTRDYSAYVTLMQAKYTRGQNLRKGP